MIQVNRKILPDKFFVAVSAGVDSIAGAHLLHRLGYDISICHFDHCFQSENIWMVDNTIQFAEDFGIEVTVGQRTNGSHEIEGSIESELRNARFKFFRSLNAPIVCCHHLDDAVENYVLNFLRGCPEYMPIQWVTPLNDSETSIIHPFLNTTKDDFLDYAKNNDLMKYVTEDESNMDTKYRRNWIRHDILPQFKDFGLRKIVRKKFYGK